MCVRGGEGGGPKKKKNEIKSSLKLKFPDSLSPITIPPNYSLSANKHGSDMWVAFFYCF